MNLNCVLEERISQKSGKPYYVLVIKITENYQKLVFLEKAEIELIKLNSSM